MLNIIEDQGISLYNLITWLNHTILPSCVLSFLCCSKVCFFTHLFLLRDVFLFPGAVDDWGTFTQSFITGASTKAVGYGRLEVVWDSVEKPVVISRNIQTPVGMVVVVVVFFYIIILNRGKNFLQNLKGSVWCVFLCIKMACWKNIFTLSNLLLLLFKCMICIYIWFVFISDKCMNQRLKQ